MIESAFGSAPSQRPATRRKPRSTATARFGWSGVEKLVRPRGIRRRLRDVILLLPHRRSTITALTEELLGLGAHYHRNLRQDEFGPTRAQEIAALRYVLLCLGSLIFKLRHVPARLRAILSGEFARGIASLPVLPFDDEMLERLYEAASDLECALTRRNLGNQAALVADAVIAAYGAHQVLIMLDTNTAGQVVLDTVSRKTAVSPGEQICRLSTCLAHLRRQFKLTLERLQRKKGPLPRPSLGFLVWSLCDLWTRETGLAVTANAVRNGGYSGEPQTPAGRFVAMAIDALHPSEGWIRRNMDRGPPSKRMQLFMIPAGHRARAAHQVMRSYVRFHRPAGTRRGRRPRVQ